MSQERAGRCVLLPPHVLPNGLQVSVHSCPKSLLREAVHVFPGITIGPNTLVVPTCQRAGLDLVKMGADVDKEKDRLLEVFVGWAQDVCKKLREAQHWADFIDPCSGLPMIDGGGTSLYSEVEGMTLLLQYRQQSAGMCKVLSHPQWGTNVYPATLFTNAPFQLVQDIINASVE